LRGNFASLSVAVKRSSMGRDLFMTIALSFARLAENFFVRLRLRLFFSMDDVLAIYLKPDP
jgi:hypothetical protein